MPPKKVPISLKSSIEAVLDVVASSSEEKVVSKALVALVELTGGEGPKAIRNKSLQALGVANPAVLKADISLPVVTALTSVITKFKTSEKILLKACAVIANTATTEVIGDLVVPALAVVLTDPTVTPVVIKAVSLLLHDVASESVVVKAVCQPLLPSLAVALKANPTSPLVSDAVGKAVVSIASGASFLKHGAVEAGLVTAFVSVIDAQKDLKDKVGSMAACGGLRVLARGSQACQIACLDAAPSLLFAMAAHCDIAEVNDHACAAFASIAGGGKKCREYLLGMRADLFPTLLVAATLHHDTPSIAEHVCLFFKEMAAAGKGDEGGRKALVEFKLVPQLLDLLLHHPSNPTIAAYTAATLALLCGDRGGVEECWAQGVVKVLERGLCSKFWEAPAQIQAIRCLERMLGWGVAGAGVGEEGGGGGGGEGGGSFTSTSTTTPIKWCCGGGGGGGGAGGGGSSAGSESCLERVRVSLAIITALKRGTSKVGGGGEGATLTISSGAGGGGDGGGGGEKSPRTMRNISPGTSHLASPHTPPTSSSSSLLAYQAKVRRSSFSSKASGEGSAAAAAAHLAASSGSPNSPTFSSGSLSSSFPPPSTLATNQALGLLREASSALVSIAKVCPHCRDVCGKGAEKAMLEGLKACSGGGGPPSSPVLKALTYFNPSILLL